MDISSFHKEIYHGISVYVDPAFTKPVQIVGKLEDKPPRWPKDLDTNTPDLSHSLYASRNPYVLRDLFASLCSTISLIFWTTGETPCILVVDSAKALSKRDRVKLKVLDWRVVSAVPIIKEAQVQVGP